MDCYFLRWIVLLNGIFFELFLFLVFSAYFFTTGEFSVGDPQSYCGSEIEFQAIVKFFCSSLRYVEIAFRQFPRIFKRFSQISGLNCLVGSLLLELRS